MTEPTTTDPTLVADPPAVCHASRAEPMHPGYVRRPCELPAGHYPATPHRWSTGWMEAGDPWPEDSSWAAMPRTPVAPGEYVVVREHVTGGVAEAYGPFPDATTAQEWRDAWAPLPESRGGMCFTVARLQSWLDQR